MNPKVAIVFFMIVFTSIPVVFPNSVFEEHDVIAQDVIPKVNKQVSMVDPFLSSAINDDNSNFISLEKLDVANTSAVDKICPQGYGMIEGACRPLPSQQPNPPVSVPICPSGYYASTGGLCESLRKSD